MTRKDQNSLASLYLENINQIGAKLASSQEMASMLAKHPKANKPTKMGIALGDKIVDKDSIRIGGISSTSKYPDDFVDAFVDYAQFDDGVELNEQELEQLAADYPGLVNGLARELAYQSL
jgi:hypothetical protein